MANKVDFIQIADCIFKNKHKYSLIDDIDKEDNFFIINRKIGMKTPLQANVFNKKSVDKASALDFWFGYFRKLKGVPGWWYQKSTKVKEKKIISGPDRKLLIQYHGISERDIEFLMVYDLEELKEELKKIKKFKGE